MNLGELINALKPLPSKALVGVADLQVCILPYRVNSYRGYYRDLASGVGSYTHECDVDVFNLVHTLEMAVGSVHTGYKGGEFKMKRSTRLRLANYGHCGVAITGIRKAWPNAKLCFELTWKHDDERYPTPIATACEHCAKLLKARRQEQIKEMR